MTETAGVKARIKRCAVCKIDLKGRFVYIDDGIEKILGYTKEELFGKLFLDFLKETDHEVFNQLLVHRNHYESFFETANIHLVNRLGQVIPATVVVSLNFIAGNPVNFQIIINAGTIDRITETADIAVDDYEKFLKEFLASDVPYSNNELVCQLRNFTRADAVFIYKIENDRLNLDSSTLPFEGDQTVAGPLHLRAAQTGETYSFTDRENVQQAVEREGAAPAEYVIRMGLDDGYLLRLVFADDLSTEAAAEATFRTSLAVRLVDLRLRYQKPGREAVLADDVSFTLNFLDTLGIGALVTDTSGMIRDRNAEAVKLFGRESLTGHYRGLADSLARDNSPEVARSIGTFIELNGENQQVDFDIVVNLPGGHKTLLTIFKQALAGSDIAACLLFSPLEMMNQESYSKALEYKLLTLLVKELKAFLKTAVGFSDKLGHEFYNQLKSDGNFYLLCLKDNLSKLECLLENLARHITTGEDFEVPRLTDLNLTVNQVLQELQTVFPGVTVNLKMNDMPKIKTWRNKIAQILRDVLCNLIKFSDRNKFEITVNARIINNRCEIEIFDDGPAISESYRKQFFDFFTTLPIKNQPATADKTGEPAIIKQLVESLGGRISLNAAVEEGNRVKLVLPVIQG
ncbi:MAG: PAS domain-containing protein [candidate division Zixibacteria bacterium]|nr:PAS domain-containing protein [candidate division Zixibacteria bacterium]